MYTIYSIIYFMQNRYSIIKLNNPCDLQEITVNLDLNLREKRLDWKTVVFPSLLVSNATTWKSVPLPLSGRWAAGRCGRWVLEGQTRKSPGVNGSRAALSVSKTFTHRSSIPPHLFLSPCAASPHLSNNHLCHHHHHQQQQQPALSTLKDLRRRVRKRAASVPHRRALNALRN